MKSGSCLERTLSAGKFAVTAEIMPTKTPGTKIIQKKTGILRDYVVAANLTDNQSAVVRMASLAASKIVLDAGVEPVMQVTCRDRNRMAIQSDVLGAAALGIRNILCVTGDHQKFGNHPHAKNVYDIDSIQCVRMLKDMRDEGCFQNGEPIRNRKSGKIVPPKIFIGAAANPFAYPRHFRPYRLAKKVNAGADFIQTQPVFDMETFANWWRVVRDLGLHERAAILAGVTPVKSVDALRYMQERVPGMAIPESVIRRMAGARDPVEEGIRLAVETVEELLTFDGIRGVHFMAIGWEKIVPYLVERCGLKTVYCREE